MITQNNKRVQYTASANGRHLRLEVYGELTDTEKLFLSGISHFTACTMSRHDDLHTKYVSGIMYRLVKYLTMKK